MNKLSKLLGLAAVPTIRKKVGDVLSVNLLADTHGLAVHSIGCDLYYPAVLQFSSAQGSSFDVATAKHFPDDKRCYVTGEQNSDPLAGDGHLLAGMTFKCTAPGTGLVLALDNVQAHHRTEGAFTSLPAEGQNAEVDIDAAEPETPGARVVVRVVVE